MVSKALWDQRAWFKEFVPTKTMIQYRDAYFQALLDPDFPRRKGRPVQTKVEELAGINQSSVSKWKKLRQWNDWMAECLVDVAEKVQDRLGEVYSHALFQAINSSDPRWTDIVLKRFDKNYKQREVTETEVHVKGMEEISDEDLMNARRQIANVLEADGRGTEAEEASEPD